MLCLPRDVLLMTGMLYPTVGVNSRFSWGEFFAMFAVCSNVGPCDFVVGMRKLETHNSAIAAAADREK